MKRGLHFICFFVSLCFLGACEMKDKKEKSEEAEKLYQESIETLNLFISQIQSANDSISIDSLLERYEKKITDINFAVSPETDLKLTEQQNDSIYKLIEKLQRVTATKYHDFWEIYQLRDTI